MQHLNPLLLAPAPTLYLNLVYCPSQAAAFLNCLAAAPTVSINLLRHGRSPTPKIEIGRGGWNTLFFR